MILVDAGAVVVDECGVGWIHTKREVELVEGFLVHAVDAEGLSGDEVDVPVVACGLEEVFDAVARGLFFTAGEEHVDAVEVGFDGAGIKLEGFIEGAAGFEDVHLATEAVAGILKVGDAEAGPAGGVELVLFDDGLEEFAGAVEVVAAAGAGHEGREDGAGLEVFFGDACAEGGSGGGGGAGGVVGVLKVADALQGAEDFVADFGLDGDEIERGHVDGTAGADGLAGDVEELPVEVEAFVGAEEVSGEDEVDEEFLADTEWVELLGGDGHERAGGADDEGWHAGEAGGDGVGESVAIERGDVGGAEVDEGEDDDGVLFVDGGVAGLSESLGEHGEDAGSALLFFGGIEWEATLGWQEGDGVSGHSDTVELHGHHDGFEGFADVGGGGEAGGGLLLEAAEDDGLKFDGEGGDDLANGGWVGVLDGADGLEFGGVGAVEGVAAGNEFVEDEAEGEDVGLD